MNSDKNIPTPRTNVVTADFAELVRKYTNAAMPTQVIVDGLKLVHAELACQLERELVAAQDKNAALRAALIEVKNWYDRDGSVGGCDMVMDEVDKALMLKFEEDQKSLKD